MTSDYADSFKIMVHMEVGGHTVWIDCSKSNAMVAVQEKRLSLAYASLQRVKNKDNTYKIILIATIMKLFPGYRKVLYASLFCSTFQSMIYFFHRDSFYA